MSPYRRYKPADPLRDGSSPNTSWGGVRVRELSVTYIRQATA